MLTRIGDSRILLGPGLRFQNVRSKLGQVNLSVSTNPLPTKSLSRPEGPLCPFKQLEIGNNSAIDELSSNEVRIRWSAPSNNRRRQ